jgi:hypothetical protein
VRDVRDASAPEGPWKSALYSALVVTGPALTCRAQMWIARRQYLCGRPVVGLAEDFVSEWRWSCEAHLTDPSTVRYIRIVQRADAVGEFVKRADEMLLGESADTLKPICLSCGTVLVDEHAPCECGPPLAESSDDRWEADFRASHAPGAAERVRSNWTVRHLTEPSS